MEISGLNLRAQNRCIKKLGSIDRQTTLETINQRLEDLRISHALTDAESDDERERSLRDDPLDVNLGQRVVATGIKWEGNFCTIYIKTFSTLIFSAFVHIQ